MLSPRYHEWSKMLKLKDGARMPYKVFFVEDEIITREGIRENVDWQSNGFEYCGEASDGEPGRMY
jgi:hypothetical protein